MNLFTIGTFRAKPKHIVRTKLLPAFLMRKLTIILRQLTKPSFIIRTDLLFPALTNASSTTTHSAKTSIAFGFGMSEDTFRFFITHASFLKKSAYRNLFRYIIMQEIAVVSSNASLFDIVHTYFLFSFGVVHMVIY